MNSGLHYTALGYKKESEYLSIPYVKFEIAKIYGMLQ